MVTYKEYTDNATKNKFELMPEKEWTALNNQLIKDRIYFKKKDEINDNKIDNMLYKIKSGKEL